MVSHTPLLYFPRQFRVNGTISSTIAADHPFIKKEARIFLKRSELLLSLPFKYFFRENDILYAEHRDCYVDLLLIFFIVLFP